MDSSGCLDCEGDFDDWFYGELLVEFGRQYGCSEIRRCYDEYHPTCMAGMDMVCNQMFIADCPTEHDVDEATRICEQCPP